MTIDQLSKRVYCDCLYHKLPIRSISLVGQIINEKATTKDVDVDNKILRKIINIIDQHLDPLNCQFVGEIKVKLSLI